jgi:hypothetical protein
MADQELVRERRERRKWSRDTSRPSLANFVAAAQGRQRQRSQMVKIFTFQPCTDEELMAASRVRRQKAR